MDLKSIYKDVQEIYPSILKHKIPSSIYKELQRCIKHTDKIRKNKLACLLEHHNVGNNSYQVSLPFNLLEGSFFQAYLILLGELYRCRYENLSLKDTRRTVRLRKHGNHFDSYDVWVNYTEQGSVNDKHHHQGALSGVIYYTDCKNSPTCFENGFSYRGKKGDIIMFPSNTIHYVPVYNDKKSRVTIAYNLYYC
tara:strand:- start:115 stop:696 length:582 start_codon:yes stop_codon:yes gene_type:complete